MASSTVVRIESTTGTWTVGQPIPVKNVWFAAVEERDLRKPFAALHEQMRSQYDALRTQARSLHAVWAGATAEVFLPRQEALIAKMDAAADLFDAVGQALNDFTVLLHERRSDMAHQWADIQHVPHDRDALGGGWYTWPKEIVFAPATPADAVRVLNCYQDASDRRAFWDRRITLFCQFRFGPLGKTWNDLASSLEYVARNQPPGEVPAART